ncbi:MAG: hypothetical protein RL311_700 [Bacteroidota bacterium]|jgi:hypothetical protein
MWDNLGRFWDDFFNYNELILFVLCIEIVKSSQVPRKRVSKSEADDKKRRTKTWRNLSNT